MISSNFLLYILIGLFNTLLGYLIIFSFMYLGFFPEISNFFGYFILIFISYYFNKKYNFKIKSHYGKDLYKFIISMGIAYLLNLIILIVCYKYLEVNTYISQVIAGIVYTLSGYILSKVWVFNINHKVKINA